MALVPWQDRVLTFVAAADPTFDVQVFRARMDACSWDNSSDKASFTDSVQMFLLLGWGDEVSSSSRSWVTASVFIFSNWYSPEISRLAKPQYKADYERFHDWVDRKLKDPEPTLSALDEELFAYFS